MNPKSLAIDARMLHFSGIGTYLRALLPRLISQAPELQFHLIGDPGELAACTWAGAPNVALIGCGARVYSAGEQLQLWRSVPAQCGVLWSPHYNIPMLTGKRLVVTIHDLFHLATLSELQGVHKRLYARLLFGAVARKAERVICVSEFTAGELARLTGMERARMRVIHNGVEPSWSGVERVAPRDGRPYFLYVGNVKPHKNLARLVDAFAGVAGRVPHDLVIVGKREGFITGDETVAGRAASLGERVRFTGFIDDCELACYFAGADCLVFPSLYEGFGLPPLEAMACGCPVLASRAASLPEVCADAALYCDPYSVPDIAEKLVLMAGDRPLREDLARRGRERAGHFSWDRAAQQTLAVLREALQG
jgi:glycosyltransferase involved in cell wall biosynthesis